jgi:Na+-driven multidrug efflux pump
VAPTSSTHTSVLRLAAPLVVSFMMRAAFTFVDTAYAASIGDAAVAAIGLTVPFEFLMIAIWVGVSTGLTSALSRALGAREGRKMDQYLRLTWKLVLWISPLFALMGAAIWFAAPRFGLDPEVHRNFQIYGATLVVGTAFTSFWSIIPDSVVKVHHDTRSTMWAGIWSNLINVTLNTLFLFVFGWGIFGIALSTVVGRIGGLVYALWRARLHENRRKSEAKDTEPGLDPAPYRTVMGLAVPSSMTFVLMAGETAVVNALLAGMQYSTEAIAAYSIYYRITLFALNPVIAGGVALLPYAARRFGEADPAGARRGLREVGVASALYSVLVVAPVVLISAPWLADWLAETPVTRDYTALSLLFVPLSCLFMVPFLLCRPVFEAMNRGRPGLVVATLRFVVLTVPAAWLGMRLAEGMGYSPLYGLVVGLLVVSALTSGVFYLWVNSALAALVRAPFPAPLQGSQGGK